jgi:hypothetical protein
MDFVMIAGVEKFIQFVAKIKLDNLYTVDFIDPGPRPIANSITLKKKCPPVETAGHD